MALDGTEAGAEGAGWTWSSLCKARGPPWGRHIGGLPRSMMVSGQQVCLDVGSELFYDPVLDIAWCHCYQTLFSNSHKGLPGFKRRRQGSHTIELPEGHGAGPLRVGPLELSAEKCNRGRQWCPWKGTVRYSPCSAKGASASVWSIKHHRLVPPRGDGHLPPPCVSPAP